MPTEKTKKMKKNNVIFQRVIKKNVMLGKKN